MPTNPSPETISRREDEAQLRELAYRYARMMDNRSFDDLPLVFADKGVLSGPGYKMTGHIELRQGLSGLEQYERTLHAVHNSYFEIDGDAATGEVYCVANHIYAKEGVPFKLDMGIRYRDTYARIGGEWVIAERVFDMVWESDGPMVTAPDGQPVKA